MKHLLRKMASLLTLAAMLLSLSVCALAAEDPVPLYQQFGYDSEDEFMFYEIWSYKKDLVTYDWIEQEFQVQYQSILANPQSALDYWGLESFDELDEMIELGVWDSYEEFYQDIDIFLVNDSISDYPVPLSVQFNGETVPFPDAQPEVVSNRTMVPFRFVSEAMGFTVDYDSTLIKAEKDGTSIEFFIGKSEYTLTTAAGTETKPTDVSPYIKQNRTFVPVRFFAEAMGMTVLWDSDYNCAVIYDAEKLAADIDKDFTVINKWLKAQQPLDQSKTWREISSLDMTLTLLDSIDGNVTYPVTVNMEAISKGESQQLHISCDLADIIQLLTDENPEVAVLEEFFKTARIDSGNLTMDAIYDADNDILYFNCPVLALYLLYEQDGMLPSNTTPATAWFKLSGIKAAFTADIPAALSDDTLAQLQNLSEDATFGKLVVWITEQNAYYPSSTYAALSEATEALKSVLGDARFTRSGSEYTAHFDKDMLGEDADLLGDEVAFGGELKLNTATGACSFNFDIKDSSSYSKTLVHADGSLSQSRSTLNMTFHEKNAFILKMTMTSSMNTTSAAPAKQPPAGSAIIDLSSYLAG